MKVDLRMRRRHDLGRGPVIRRGLGRLALVAGGLGLTGLAAWSATLPSQSAAVPPKAGHSTPVWSLVEIQAVQEKLRDLGYWLPTANGHWDEISRQELVAFQKAEWRKPTGVLSREEYEEVMKGFAPAARETKASHVEVDLARQILFMVDEHGSVSHILPISSGSGKHFRAPGWDGTADTPCGHFTVFQKGWGWQKSPLGEMHNPMYLVGGIAIHGSPSVPPKPASHGCIRIPMYASQTLTKLVPKETPVVVYGCRDEEPTPPFVPGVVAATVSHHSQ
jgi:N-acetylmuramoyl-L-alanine amidase